MAVAKNNVDRHLAGLSGDFRPGRLANAGFRQFRSSYLSSQSRLE